MSVVVNGKDAHPLQWVGVNRRHPHRREVIADRGEPLSSAPMRSVDVQFPEGAGQSYSIAIEGDSLARLGEIVQSHIGFSGKRVLLAVDAGIADTHGLVAAQSLRHAGFEVASHALIAEEKQKSLGAVRGMYDAMLAARLDRNSFVVALGGGIVGDIAGFAAATFMRGLPIVQVPSTLLAMVDAAFGGKTGVNVVLPDGAIGKNLIGAFWQPRAVVVDPKLLLTLDDRHFRCGLAECVKHGMIEAETSKSRNVEMSKDGLIEFLTKQATAIMAKDMKVLAELIGRSAAIKAAFVMEDERETGRRALLNLGHTFGHGLESVSELNLLHGEAVAVGLVAAMQCSVETGRMTGTEAERVRSLLISMGLPTRVPTPVAASRVRAAMQHDKKSKDGNMRLVLPMGLGNATIADDVPAAVLARALKEIGLRGED